MNKTTTAKNGSGSPTQSPNIKKLAAVFQPDSPKSQGQPTKGPLNTSRTVAVTPASSTSTPTPKSRPERALSNSEINIPNTNSFKSMPARSLSNTAIVVENKVTAMPQPQPQPSSATTMLPRARAMSANTSDEYTKHGTFILPENRGKKEEENDEGAESSKPGFIDKFKKSASKILFNSKYGETSPESPQLHAFEKKQLKDIQQELEAEFEVTQFKLFCNYGGFRTYQRKYIQMFTAGSDKEAVKVQFRNDFKAWANHPKTN